MTRVRIIALTLLIGLPACLLFNSVAAGIVAQSMGVVSHG